MKFITLERQRRGWSQAELARRAGMHPTQISMIEHDRLQPYPGQIRKLAAALGLSDEEGQRLLHEVDEDGHPRA